MNEIICEPTEKKRGRRSTGKAQSKSAECKKYRAKKKEESLSRIAILDMETDPFDNERPDLKIEPFLAVLYGDDFETVVIWEEDNNAFCTRLLSAIEALPGKYTIYAHNGGKFDFMFLVHRLRGKISFKGRGIMEASIGSHKLRDSFHIIPERLANFKKDHIDYENMRRGKRQKFKQEIIDYCIADCRYLLDIVKTFVGEYGFKISIGQAAMAVLKKEYKVASLPGSMDAYLRHYFFGGRVECLQGKGEWIGDYKLYDVNSMYPYAMAHYHHPIGSEYKVRRGKPGPHTIFIEIACINRGALVTRDEAGNTVAPWGRGIFKTTIWEYQTALRLGLIEDVKILWCIDCQERTDFSRFVVPLYEKRQETKERLKSLPEHTREYDEVKKDDIFYKLILNNAYGKFAQNPRRFKEHYLTDPDEAPPVAELKRYEDEDDERFAARQKKFEWSRSFLSDQYAIWERPCTKLRFNNVGTAASITGAARSILMEAIHNATDAIYCDTDSLICRALDNVPIHKTDLGAWDLERTMSSVVIAGKKLYAYKDAKTAEPKVKSKGANDLTYDQLVSMLKGEIVESRSKAITMTRTGKQSYMVRQVRATAPDPQVVAIARRNVRRNRIGALAPNQKLRRETTAAQRQG